MQAMKMFSFYNRFLVKKRLSNFWLFELSVWLHVLGKSLLAIFIPILLLERGFSIQEVLWYFAIYHAIDVPLNLAADRFVRRFGAIQAVVVGTISSIIYLLILAGLDSPNWPLLITMASLAAVYDVLYWVAHLYLFAKAEDKHGDVAGDTGLLAVARRLGSMAGPVVGGVLLILGNEKLLILGSVFILCLSLLPLIRMRAIENRPSTKRPPFRQFLKSGGDRYNWFTTLCVSLHGAAEEVLWPLFIFVLFGTVQSVALLAAITSVGTVIFSYLTGKLSRLHPLRLIALGSLFIALTWTVRLGTDNPTVHYGSLLVMGFFTLLVAIPTESRLIMRAKESEPLSVMAYRNAVSMSAPLVLFVVLGTLSEVFRNGFTAAAAGMFSLLLVTTVFALRERRIRASTSRP